MLAQASLDHLPSTHLLKRSSEDHFNGTHYGCTQWDMNRYVLHLINLFCSIFHLPKNHLKNFIKPPSIFFYVVHGLWRLVVCRLEMGIRCVYGVFRWRLKHPPLWFSSVFCESATCGMKTFCTVESLRLWKTTLRFSTTSQTAWLHILAETS